MKTVLGNTLLSAETFLKAHFFKIMAAIAAFYAPIVPLLLGAIMFSFAAFITGIVAAYKKAKTAGQPKWLDSKKMQKKIFDLVFYMLAIVLAFYIEKNFLDFFALPICKLVCFIIFSTEFWSNMENIGVITGMPLNKDAFMDVVNKLRKNGITVDTTQAVQSNSAPPANSTETTPSAQ
jgi:hypothetical protein